MNDRDDVIHIATEASYGQRRLGNLPEDMSPGAREIALLTSVTKAQASTIKPMSDALLALKELGPDIWQAEFLVSDQAKFNWRTAPWRYYASFEDFYDRELAPVYGDYEDFIHDADQVVQGTLSAEEAAERARIRTARRSLALDVVDRADINGPRAGTLSDEDRQSNCDIVTIRGANEREVELGGGNSADYLTRVIKRDHPEIHERMRAGDYKSVRAAARDAGVSHRTPTRRRRIPEFRWRTTFPLDSVKPDEVCQ